MSITILSSNSFKTTSWTGGNSTQLFIYPLSAEYNKLDFEFRLSLATVLANESIFTSLPGVTRKLLVLNGNITLIHENQYTKELNKFAVDAFQGDWKTRCLGTCTDFNLMTIGTRSSKLLAMDIHENDDVKYDIIPRTEWLFLYLYTGEISLRSKNKNHHIAQGDFCVITGLTPGSISLKGIKPSALVIVEIDRKAV